MEIALEERINTHTSYINTEKTIQLLDEIYLSNLTTKQIERLGRIQKTFYFLKESLDKVDPWLISINTLANLNAPISNILGELTNFKNDKNDQRLNNIFSHLEQLIQYFPQILVTKTPEEIEGVRNSVIKFRQSVGQHLSHLEKSITETSTALIKNTEKLNELTSATNDQKTRVDSIVNEFQKQFLDAQTQRGQEFSNFINKGESDLKGTLESIEDSLEQQTTTQQNSFGSLIEELKSKVQTELDQIQEMNKEAEKILGLISMKGLAHGYQKIANNEGRKAFIWNILSVLSIIGILLFGYKFIILHQGTMSWTTLVSRIVLTGVGLTLFTYCSKQATIHRSEERRNRKIELELASLDPYLKDLEPSHQKEVKENLVNKYFGVELPNTNGKQPLVQQQNITEAITNNPQFIQNVVEKVSQLVNKQ